MLANIGKSGFGSWYSLQTVPSLTPGVSVTPGAGSEGNYVQSAAALAFDVYGIRVWVVSGSTTSGIRDILLDIHIDQAGGTSYAALGGISNLFVPQDSSAVNSGRWFYFPLFIKAGSTVGVRGQSNIATTFRVAIWYFGRPTRPEALQVAQYSETLGVSGNGGTPFSCGNTSGWGSWTSLGTTTRPCWHWTLAWGNNAGTTTAQAYMAELAYSPDAGTTFWTIIPCAPMHNPGTSEISGSPLLNGVWEVPAGGALYVRGSATGTPETTEAVAIGLGG
jgi:hypothetical protein